MSKNIWLAGVWVLVFSTAASAAPQKICFGSGDAKGERFELSITKDVATISRAVGSGVNGTEGDYKTDGSVAGRDGKKYLAYEFSRDEGVTDLLVDEALLEEGTQGLAKIRWQGEAFSQSTYFCRDEQ